MNDPRSLWTKLTLLPVLALLGVNVALVLSFWSSFGGEDALAFQVLGVALLFIEMTALVVAADANVRGAQHKAWAWFCVFGLVVLVNLFADFGAVVTRSARDAEARAQARALYDAASVAAREADAEIARLAGLLAAEQRHRPVAALRAEYTAAVDRVGAYQRIDRQPPYRLVDRVAAAEAALATAEALAAVEARRDSARATMTQFGARPPGEHPQFEAAATLLNSLGVDASPGQVRVWLAVPIAIILKAVLVFGLWVLTLQERREGGDGDGLSAREAPPVMPTEPERRGRTGHDRPAAVRGSAGALEDDDFEAALAELEAEHRLS